MLMKKLMRRHNDTLPPRMKEFTDVPVSGGIELFHKDKL